MVNRPKAIGTRAETAVARYAHAHGFPHADRRALAGSLDRGDILVCPGIIAEVKGGAAAETASDELIRRWLAETERERVNAGAAIAVLVTKRRGVGPQRAGQWAAWMPFWTLAHVEGTAATAATHRARQHYRDVPVRLTLADTLTLLRAAGYGEPLAEVRS